MINFPSKWLCADFMRLKSNRTSSNTIYEYRFYKSEELIWLKTLKKYNFHFLLKPLSKFYEEWLTSGIIRFDGKGTRSYQTLIVYSLDRQSPLICITPKGTWFPHKLPAGKAIEKNSINTFCVLNYANTKPQNEYIVVSKWSHNFHKYPILFLKCPEVHSILFPHNIQIFETNSSHEIVNSRLKMLTHSVA